jgi:hypothetical protein
LNPISATCAFGFSGHQGKSTAALLGNQIAWSVEMMSGIAMDAMDAMLPFGTASIKRIPVRQWRYLFVLRR